MDKKSQTPVVDRRNFLRTSALAGGGMLIGFNLFTACKQEIKPPVDISQLNFKDFNAFIRIAEDGYVTLFSPNPEIGQGVKTSMPMIIAEELDVEWEKVLVEQGKLNTNDFDRQVAGGSQSIRHGWDALRETGATAKAMLIKAAAQRWDVDPKSCNASKGVITNAKGDRLDYGSVATEAADLEIPENVTLKDPKDYRIIGTNAINVDMDKIVTGKPLFGLDYKRKGMMTCCILRPPAFGQKLESYDDTAARKVNGVEEIVQISDKVAVVARNTWSAMKGKKALQATWKDVGNLESSEDHERILSDILDGQDFNIKRTDGDVVRAFEEADQILERTYHAPFMPHNCMEPMNFFAHVTDEKVDLVGPIQTPAGTAQNIADKLGRDLNTVSVEMTRMGGGFGRRLYGDFAMEAAEVSAKIGKAVKVVFSREDDMTDGIYRPAQKFRIKAAIKDGQISAYQLKEATVNRGMWDSLASYFPATAIDNLQILSKQHTSPITTGAWRAPVTHFMAVAEQSFFSELAEMLEMDHKELMIQLLKKAQSKNDENREWSPERMMKTIELAAEKAKWDQASQGVYQGLSAYYSHNTHVAEIAEVQMENDKPVIKKVVVAVDCGIVVNPTGAINQVQGGVLDGIGHAMYPEFEFANGKPLSNNFNQYRLIRIKETPDVEVHFVESKERPTGLGEPGLPPAGAAVANAIYAATGKRLYRVPFQSEL
jgi:isoquinoline 1-oxidoreductase beta subunit